jgi:hypothetical protein
MTRAFSRLRRFFKSETGAYSVEGVLVLPLLIWGVMASVVLVDAYRMKTQNLRATYVISDAVSRLWDPVTDDYFVGLWDLHGMQVAYRHPTNLRMTALQYSLSNDRYVVRWSQTTSEERFSYLTQEQVDARQPNIPNLADGDSLVLVETWMDYTPFFSIGLPAMVFGQEIFVSPRYAPQIDYQSDDGGAGA